MPHRGPGQQSRHLRQWAARHGRGAVRGGHRPGRFRHVPADRPGAAGGHRHRRRGRGGTAASRRGGTATGDRSARRRRRGTADADRGPAGRRRRHARDPVRDPLARAERRAVRELPHPERQRHAARLLPPVRAHLRGRGADEEVADRGGLGPRAARRGGGGRGAVRQARRGDQLLRPAEQLPWRRHLGDRRRRAHRADPPRDAAVVRAAEPADAARADEGSGTEAGRRVVRDPRRRADRRARLDGALHAGGLGTRRVQLRLRPARRQRRAAPVRGRRSGEHEGEHPARRRSPPRLHALRRGRRARAPEALPPSQQGAVQNGRRARARPRAHLPARAADGSAHPPRDHAGSRDGRVPRPRDHARPDPHAPLERLQRAVDHGRVARLCHRHTPGRRGEADRRDRRDHRRRPGLRPSVRRPDGADVHDAGDQGDDADLPADAGHDPPQPQGRDARPLPDPEGRHDPRRDARRAARPALLGAGRRQVRSRPVRDGEGRRPAAPRIHPVLDREAAVHGARGHVHDAPRRPVRDLPPLPAASRAGRDGGEEHDRDDEAGRGSDHPPAARAGRAPAGGGRGT